MHPFFKHITMKPLYSLAVFALLLQFSISCNSPVKSNTQQPQPANAKKPVGGGCDGCEIMYAGMPAVLAWADTSDGWHENGQRLLVTGTVFKPDGKTPAPDVIIYYWHTDNNGHYTPKANMNEKAKLHGYLRGWIKTDAMGRYAMYTIKPAPYPNEDMPAHIHIAIKEPHINNEYYIDDFVFDDDTLLTTEKRKALENRGGSGILHTIISDHMHMATHNIMLGLNIPHYPEKK